MSTQAYPLHWPKGWPETEHNRREKSKFTYSLPAAMDSMRRQLAMMGATGLTLSSNYTLGSERPKNPGVVAYFTLDGSQVAIPCDRWDKIEDNVRAIALTLEAMRGIERWGAKSMIKAMFTGFRALPERAGGIDALAVLGIKDKHPTEEQVSAAFRERSKMCHPDMADGSAEKWAELREAHDIAMAAARGRK